MTKSHQLVSLTALVLSPLSYANNSSYDDEVASAANKANLVMQATIEAEKDQMKVVRNLKMF